MRIRYEFRINEEYAGEWLSPTDGEKIGDSVRKLVIYDDDPRLEIVKEANGRLASQGKFFYVGSSLTFKYSKDELRKAELFRIGVPNLSNLAGEMHGTVYDEDSACPLCGSGARQLTPLYLPFDRLPQTASLFCTLAGEILISRMLKDILEINNITGLEYLPVYDGRQSQRKSDAWFQVSVTGRKAKVARLTRTGNRIFDEDPLNISRCPNGDLVGLNIHSEVFLERETVSDRDFLLSQEYFGVRRGLIRPYRCMFITPKVWRLLVSHRIKRFRYEIARMA